MEKVLNITTENEENSLIVTNLLKQLDRDDELSLGQYYIVDTSSGTPKLKSGTGEVLDITALSEVASGLVSIIGGPTLAKSIPLGKSAVIAHVWEEWEIPTNVDLKQVSLDIVRHDVHEEYQKTDNLNVVVKVRKKQLQKWEENEKQKLAELNEKIKTRFQEVNAATLICWKKTKVRIQKQIHKHSKSLAALSDRPH